MNEPTSTYIFAQLPKQFLKINFNEIKFLKV